MLARATAWRTFDVSLDRDEMGHCFKSLVHRGHSTTTWAKFSPILTNYPTRVDNCGHFKYYTYPPFAHVNKRVFSTENLPIALLANVVIE